jgi:hypothetical protein
MHARMGMGTQRGQHNIVASLRLVGRGKVDQGNERRDDDDDDATPPPRHPHPMPAGRNLITGRPAPAPTVPLVPEQRVPFSGAAGAVARAARRWITGWGRG